jgi:hypothetical protein
MTQDPSRRHKITVIVDKREHHLDTAPETGAELRAALGIPADRDLYQIVPAHDDLLVEDSTRLEQLKSGTRFFTAPRNITPGRPR